MPQWLLAAKCEIVAANLRKIEKGTTQPGVMLAVRLLAATSENVGECLRLLAEDDGIVTHGDGEAAQILDDALVIRIRLITQKIPEKACLFGPVFKEFRLVHKVSQKFVAEKAHYHLRNILEVESGRREPGVMTALAMVAAIGADVEIFFTKLHELSSGPK